MGSQGCGWAGLLRRKTPAPPLPATFLFEESFCIFFFLFLSFLLSLSSFLPSAFLPFFFFILLFICFFLFFFPSLFSCSSFPPSFLPALLSFLSHFLHSLLPFFFRTQFILGSFLSSSMLSFPLDFRSPPAFLVFLCGAELGEGKAPGPGACLPGLTARAWS